MSCTDLGRQVISALRFKKIHVKQTHLRSMVVLGDLNVLLSACGLGLCGLNAGLRHLALVVQCGVSHRGVDGADERAGDAASDETFARAFEM
jgi:hypothetical protein